MPQAAFDTHAETGKLKRAGWPEGQVEAMVDLVTRAPLNPQLAQGMEWLKVRVQSIDTRLQRVETRLWRVETRLLRVEDAMSGMATKADLEEALYELEHYRLGDPSIHDREFEEEQRRLAEAERP